MSGRVLVDVLAERRLKAQRALTTPCPPEENRPGLLRCSEVRPRPAEQQDALEAAAFRIFRADARDTLVIWNAEAKRPETKDEAFDRRWREMPAPNRARYLNLAAVARADR